MRANLAARYIAVVLSIRPLLTVQWVYLGWVLSGDLEDANVYLTGDYAGLVDWPVLGQWAMLLRACAMIASFSVFALAFMQVGGPRCERIRRAAVVIPAVILWAAPIAA